MESELTCILCEQKIPAKEHVHNCDNNNYVEVEKLTLPKGTEDKFLMKGHQSKIDNCKKCDKRIITDYEVFGVEGSSIQSFEISSGMCNDCQEKEKEKENMQRKKEYAKEKYQIWKKEQERRKENEISGSHFLRCKFCGQSFTLTKEDFMEHEDFCQRNSQLEN